jgi:hypothetical protein
VTDHRIQRVENLTRAAQAKRQAAIARAEAGLRTLIKSNAPVNFRSVAKTGGVSLDFLYRNDELRRRIEQLRAQQQRPDPIRAKTGPPTDTSSVVASLTARLRDAHNENVALQAQLAAAHGELLTLRRQTSSAVVNGSDTLVTDASSTK